MRVGVVTPVYNDWDSLEQLVRELDLAAANAQIEIDVFVVNDGSTQSSRPIAFWQELSSIRSIEYLHLVRNLGHQRAIAIGLVEAEAHTELEAVIVMDSDGEDRPQDIPILLAAHHRSPNAVIVAARGTRSEDYWFRWFYQLYKLLFRLLIGRAVNFGNFALVPHNQLSNLTYDPNVWNHFAAAISRARLPVERVLIHRGRRYFGNSTMNFESLVIHGLSAISVYIDVVFVRALLTSVAVAGGAFVGILVVLGILFFTDLAIPGWATNAVGILILIICQVVIFTSIAAFYVLSMRSRPLIVPAFDILKLVKHREVIYERDRDAVFLRRE
jgi:glycosyltransferase involved in cell wall biosynthesis